MGANSRGVLVGLVTLLVAGVLGAPAAQAFPAAVTQALPSGAADAAPTRNIQLILDYHVTGECQVYPNYPDQGVIGNNTSWKIAPGDIVGWRYNVNDTWAMISDKKYRKNTNQQPWWGFVQRRCIGGSVGGEHFPTPTSHYPAGQPIPNRILEGRSDGNDAVEHYKKVDFRPSPAPVVNDHQQITSMGTLRDAPNDFVIGNVLPGWHVQLTAQRNAGWTKVYVPNAKRWGWVENIHF